MRPLRVWRRLGSPFAPAVAGAFDEVNAGNRGQAPDIVHGQDQGPFNHAMQQQSVRGRIDAGHTGMVTLEMERSGSEDAVRILQRRPGGTDLGIFYIRDEARGLFKQRALSVRPEWLAEARWLCRFCRPGGL